DHLERVVGDHGDRVAAAQPPVVDQEVRELRRSRLELGVGDLLARGGADHGGLVGRGGGERSGGPGGSGTVYVITVTPVRRIRRRGHRMSAPRSDLVVLTAV